MSNWTAAMMLGSFMIAMCGYFVWVQTWIYLTHTKRMVPEPVGMLVGVFFPFLVLGIYLVLL